MNNRLLFITGSDSNQFELALDCILSIKETVTDLNYHIAFLDLGCSQDQLNQLTPLVTEIKQIGWEFGIQNHLPAVECRKGQICRPFLPEYFPDYELYFWIDADAWIQDRSAVSMFVEGATKRGAAMVPEIERSSKFYHGALDKYLQSMNGLYTTIFNTDIASKLYHLVNLNAGVFCFHKDSNLWDAWKSSLYQALQTFLEKSPTPEQTASFFGLIDQVALNHAIRSNQFISEVELLPSSCNWTCHLSLPAYNLENQTFVEPYLPNQPIGIIHLTNPWGGELLNLPNSHEKFSLNIKPVGDFGKNFFRDCLIQTNHLAVKSVSLFRSDQPKYQSIPKSKPVSKNDYDYVSPGLETIWPDSCFPFMVQGNKSACGWEYLRKDIPHIWRVDRRYPHIGFVSRDEAAILYNTAKMFKDKKGLEIGCWQGWSACHIAASGIELDIIDPILNQPQFRPTIERSLRRFNVMSNVHLHGGPSPDLVHEVAKTKSEKWSFFFIDGNHDGDAPLEDTIASLPFAADDCLMLFHDLASPHVSKALDHLKAQGWNTMIYHTAQIMGVAWRGNVQPIKHTPDPNIPHLSKSHLSSHSISM